MCPVCEQPLQRQERVFACSASHSFDIAREGYVNLVLAQHRRSASSGDPADSLRQRRAFLEAGHYTPAAQRLSDLLADLAPEQLLDAGCGEGWYLRQLHGRLPGCQLYGVDVAKEGVRLAARASAEIGYAVGNTFRLPVLNASVDAVLQVFAPADVDQVRRVLRPDGHFVEVTPGPTHLQAYRAMIYETPREHAEAPVADGLALVHQQQVTWPLDLVRREDIAALIEMTPYKWHMNPDTYARIQGLTEWQDSADFTVRVYRVAEGMS